MIIIANGICDKNHPQALWRLDDEGTLTIYGTGEMHISFETPWDEYAQDVRTFRVERGITSVSVALKNYLDLRRVEFSDTLRYDFCSFKGCVNLSEIIVPDSVEHFEDRSIEDTAWYKSQPDGAVYIGKIFYGFKGGYSGGTEFTVKDGTKGIARGSFNVKGITRVNLPDSIVKVCQSNFTFDDDILNMNIETKEFSYAPWSFSDGTLYLGNGITKDFSRLTEVVFPKGLKRISRDAFRGCSSLEEIVIPESTETIMDGAFASCGKLQRISLPDGLKYIGNGSFGSCGSLERVHLPDSLKYIGSCAFLNCEKLIDINIPENANVKSNILYNTLLARNSPTEILYHDGWALGYSREHSEKVLRFKKGTRKIASLAFGCRDCEIDDDITEVILDGDICEIGSFAFANITSLEKVSADCTFKRLGAGIFGGTPWKKNQPEGVVYLANAVLGYSGQIPEKIKIGSEHNGRKITLIAPMFIAGYDKLRELEIGANIESIGERAFSYSHILEKVTIPDSVKRIDSAAFMQCEMLKRVFIPSSVEEIGDRAFGYYYNPEYEWNDPDSPYYLRLEGFTIICERGSAAEKYATDNGFRIEYV